MSYIDPGTGSLLFSVLVSMVGAGYYLLQNARVNAKFLITGGKKEKTDLQNRIPLVIFSDHKRYWNLFEPICDELEKREQETVFYTASPDDPALEKVYKHVHCEFIGEGNKAFVKLNYLSADILLSTTPGLDVLQWKRSKNVKRYVHILHMVNDPATYRMFGLDYYDAVLLSGDYQPAQIRELEHLRNLPEKQLTVVGMPYMDRMKQRLETMENPDNSSDTTVLLAPSWGPSSILNKYGDQFISSLLKTGYHIVIRPHPQSYTAEAELIDRLKKQFPESDCLEWNRDVDNFDILSRADVLISDFSNVMFDFALVFRKPVICADTSFDKSPYDACWLKEELWTFRVLPRLTKRLEPENISSLKELIYDALHDLEFQKNVDDIIHECWSNVGHSAELTADYLIAELENMQKAESESAENKLRSGSNRTEQSIM